MKARLLKLESVLSAVQPHWYLLARYDSHKRPNISILITSKKYLKQICFLNIGTYISSADWKIEVKYVHRASLNSKRQLVWTGFERFIVAWGLLSVLVHPLLIKIPYYFLLVYKLFFFFNWKTSNLISGRSNTMFWAVPLLNSWASRAVIIAWTCSTALPQM